MHLVDGIFTLLCVRLSLHLFDGPSGDAAVPRDPRRMSGHRSHLQTQQNLIVPKWEVELNKYNCGFSKINNELYRNLCLHG